MQADLQTRRFAASLRRDAEFPLRPSREKGREHLQRRSAVQQAEALLEIREWMARKR